MNYIINLDTSQIPYTIIKDRSGDIFKMSIESHPCLTSLPLPLEQLPLLVGESVSALEEEEAILLFLVAGSSAEGEAAAAVAVAAVGAAVGAVEATTPDSALDI